MKLKSLLLISLVNLFIVSCDKIINKEPKKIMPNEKIKITSKTEYDSTKIIKKNNYEKTIINKKNNVRIDSKNNNLKVVINSKVYYKKSKFDKQLSQDLVLINNNSHLNDDELLKFAFWESTKNGYEKWYNIRNGKYIEISVGAIE